MLIYIKNMVCHRCIAAVKSLFTDLQLPCNSVQLGEVVLEKELTQKQTTILKERLGQLGFELLNDKKKKLIEQIKKLIIGQVHYEKADGRYNLSELLSSSLYKDYSYLSRLFSEVEGITIEQYFILQKIEKVKEWLVYDELTLSEIAWKLGYSSVAHLSSQFKKVTGLTPSQIKKLGINHRKSLDKV